LRSIHEIMNAQYYEKPSWILLLLPISFIYFLIISLRSWAYKVGILKVIKMDIPVVVIGNITMGGTGKTPLVIWLLEKLIKLGMKPGLICRGYNSKANSPQEVFTISEVSNVGDESLMVKLRLDIPVFVGKNKAKVGKRLLKSYPNVNILISDDGLQHLQLSRDFEIVVVDGVRRFGNEHLIPAGPLREKISRVGKVDALVINGSTKKSLSESRVVSQYEMACHGNILINSLYSDRISDLSTIRYEKEIIAVTAIGNPERFFEKLTNKGLKFQKKIFNDHHLFNEWDFKDYDDMTIIMTEKDAVKCRSFVKENFWFLPIDAVVDEKLFKKLIKKLRI
jgi:tetraacyldisaccharide 4'-kinase